MAGKWVLNLNKGSLFSLPRKSDFTCEQCGVSKRQAPAVTLNHGLFTYHCFCCESHARRYAAEMGITIDKVNTN